MWEVVTVLWLFVVIESSLPADCFSLSVVMPFLNPFLGFSNVLFVGDSIILLILVDWILDFRANNKWLLLEADTANWLFLFRLFHTYVVYADVLLFTFVLRVQLRTSVDCFWSVSLWSYHIRLLLLLCTENKLSVFFIFWVCLASLLNANWI